MAIACVVIKTHSVFIYSFVCLFVLFIRSSYAMYYENLLRHQHQLLYIKEQV